MGAHTRPGRTRLTAAPGRHRGELAPLLDVDVSAAAGRAVVGLATAGAAGAVVVTGAGAALATPAVPGSAAQAGPYAAPTAEQLAELRGCESSDDYSINTGNGYYGAYQFNLGTWQGLGYSGYPNDAPPATQDAAASKLEEERGWEPWPACSQKLGLTTTSATTARGSLTPPRVLTRTATKASGGHSHLVAATIPPFPGTTLTTSLESTKRADVLVWQSRMARRGWRITVDGYFGPKSARVAQQFAAEKKIAAVVGTVNAPMWTAAWTAPIT